MTASSLAFFLVLAALVSTAFSESDPSVYLCALCLPVAEYQITHKTLKNKPVYESCTTRFPENEDMCKVFEQKFYFSVPESIQLPSDRQLCQHNNLCPLDEPILSRRSEGGTASNSTSSLDIRVSKALGSREYNLVRLSVISDHSIESPLFSYTKQFQYKWEAKTLGDFTKSNYLNTGLVSVTPGASTTFTIEGQILDISLPLENEGVRGIIISDPCITSRWIYCKYKKTFETVDHLTSLLNAALEKSDAHFFSILGDNFYDQDGDASADWFSYLSTETKSKVISTMPGNHDLWVLGSPKLYTPKDQLGNGFMQFYGQDVYASKDNASQPYDFSVVPKGRESLPVASDFFFYNKLGNLASIGFSGAHDYNSMLPMFEEACLWAAESKPEVILILGHFNAQGDGCSANATVPAVYAELSQLPSCQAVKSKFKYFMGHKHCNYVNEENVGFMIGGLGMSDSSCAPIFGFNVIDTTDDAVAIYYFPIQQIDDSNSNGTYDNYDAILSCIQANGVSGCYDLASKWSFQSLPL